MARQRRGSERNWISYNVLRCFVSIYLMVVSCSTLLKAGGVIKGRGIIEGLPQTPALMCQNSMFYKTFPKKIHQNHVIEDRLQTHVIEDRLQTHVIEDRLQTHA